MLKMGIRMKRQPDVNSPIRESSTRIPHSTPLPRVLEPEVMDTVDVALAYETMDHSGPNAAVVGRLAELGAGGLMLDLGCGPGHIPMAVCERFADARVLGVDLSFEMLGLAAARPHERVSLLAADIKRLPFPSHVFDTVYSNTTLHHLPDPRPFLAEAWRVLKPGGVLLIRDLYRPATIERRDELVNTYAAENTPLQRQLLSDSLAAALTPEELLTAARSVGIDRAEVTIDSDRHMTLQCVYRPQCGEVR